MGKFMVLMCITVSASTYATVLITVALAVIYPVAYAWTSNYWVAQCAAIPFSILVGGTFPYSWVVHTYAHLYKKQKANKGD